MKKIKLTQGKHAMVDDEDYHWLSQRKWYAVKVSHAGTSPTWYAKRWPNLYMHQAISIRMGFRSAKGNDHADGNGLNNQRFNIRKASYTQQNGNRRKESGCRSKFKGVYWRKDRGHWVARLRHKWTSYYLGSFVEEELAARAYDNAARKIFGSFARLNAP